MTRAGSGIAEADVVGDCVGASSSGASRSAGGSCSSGCQALALHPAMLQPFHLSYSLFLMHTNSVSKTCSETTRTGASLLRDARGRLFSKNGRSPCLRLRQGPGISVPATYHHTDAFLRFWTVRTAEQRGQGSCTSRFGQNTQVVP